MIGFTVEVLWKHTETLLCIKDRKFLDQLTSDLLLKKGSVAWSPLSVVVILLQLVAVRCVLLLHFGFMKTSKTSGSFLRKFFKP